MKQFFLALLLCGSYLNAADSFVSISALRSHVEQIQVGETESPFDEEDLDQLWEESKDPEYIGLLEQAQYYYNQSDFANAKTHLDYICDHLLAYPNFDKNPFINKSMRESMAPYLLPRKHPMKPILDEIFGSSRVTANLETLKQAGFKILRIKDSSFIIVARHPKVKGYLFKLYLDSEIRTRLNKPAWQWLVKRCIGAERIRKIIKKNKIKHFTVPDKWLYPLPLFPAQGVQHPVVLLVTDMNIVKTAQTKEAWKTEVTPDHLDELYIILSNGCGSNFLSSNVPYTKSGKFSFIDTEYPKRNITLSKVKWYIAPELHSYWDQLTNE